MLTAGVKPIGVHLRNAVADARMQPLRPYAFARHAHRDEQRRQMFLGWVGLRERRQRPIGSSSLGGLALSLLLHLLGARRAANGFAGVEEAPRDHVRKDAGDQRQNQIIEDSLLIGHEITF